VNGLFQHGSAVGNLSVKGVTIFRRGARKVILLREAI